MAVEYRSVRGINSNKDNVIATFTTKDQGCWRQSGNRISVQARGGDLTTEEYSHRIYVKIIDRLHFTFVNKS